MISAREKGLFQLLVGLQIGLILAVYAFCTWVILTLLQGEVSSVRSYVKYAIVVTVALILEATFRPNALRLTPGRVRRLASAVSRRQWFWTIGGITIWLVFTKDLQISRSFLATFAVLSFFLFFFTNRYLLRILSSSGRESMQKWRLRTLVLGPQEWCESVVPELEDLHSMIQLRRVEWTDRYDHPDDYAAAVAKEPVDLLVMPPRHLPNAVVVNLMRMGDRLGFRCWMPVELTRTYGRRFDLQRVGRLDVLSPPVEPLENTLNQAVKRAFDMTFALGVCALVLPPISAIVWLIHRRYSHGPLFFKQDRVGLNGQPFKVFKFRTLHVTNGDETKQVTTSDSRIFKGGRFLRKSSLDELPQFLNVLFGDMSVVGPRPHMEAHDVEFREIFERYGVRRYVKPGVTGLAQVKGYRGEIRRSSDLRNRARLDNFYVTHWDMGMDVKIIASTVGTVIKPPKTAY